VGGGKKNSYLWSLSSWIKTSDGGRWNQREEKESIEFGKRRVIRLSTNSHQRRNLVAALLIPIMEKEKHRIIGSNGRNGGL